MIVVYDTTPLIALLKVNRLDLLKKFFGKIIIPPKVFEELCTNSVFSNEAESIKKSDFITVSDIDIKELSRLIEDEYGLDAGEAEAIALAKKITADILIVDEKRGRKVAKQNNLTIIGTVGLLMRAKEDGIINGKELKEISDGFIESKIRLNDFLIQSLNKGCWIEKKDNNLN